MRIWIALFLFAIISIGGCTNNNPPVKKHKWTYKRIEPPRGRVKLNVCTECKGPQKWVDDYCSQCIICGTRQFWTDRIGYLE